MLEIENIDKNDEKISSHKRIVFKLWVNVSGSPVAQTFHPMLDEVRTLILPLNQIPMINFAFSNCP